VGRPSASTSPSASSLWHNRYAPPRYDLLLNYCTERLLLQRIGGRYRFMHKLLQDHFANLDLD
jgi:hypothetical protein